MTSRPTTDRSAPAAPIGTPQVEDPQIAELVDAVMRNDVTEMERLADSVLDRALLEAAWR